MKLYLLEQSALRGYDVYDRCLVAAVSESAAQVMNPDGSDPIPCKQNYTWANDPKDVKVTLIGTAKRGTKPGVVIASFKAG